MRNQETQNEIIIYEGKNGLPHLEVQISGETVWLTQNQLAELFQTSRPNITMHIKNIFDEGELSEISVCKDFLHTASDGKGLSLLETPGLWMYLSPSSATSNLRRKGSALFPKAQSETYCLTPHKPLHRRGLFKFPF